MSMRVWFVVVALLLAAGAIWGRDTQWADCESEDVDTSIRGCTAIIDDLTESHGRVLEAYNRRGRAFENKGKLDEAVKDYTRAIRLSPGSDEAHYLRGFVFGVKGETEKAIADFDKAVLLNPKSSKPYIFRGLYYGDNGKFDLALVDIGKALELDPENAIAYNGLGLAYAGKGEAARAILNFDKAIALDPTLDVAYRVRGVVHFERGNFDQAFADFDKAIELNPKKAAAFELRGNAYFEKGDIDRAIEDAGRAIALEPSNAEYLNQRCWWRAVASKDLDKARADCDASLAFANDHYTLDSRGLVGLKQGRFDDAWKDYDAALRMAPGISGYLFGRGIAALRLGRTAEGNADLAAASKLNSKIAEEYARYGVRP